MTTCSLKANPKKYFSFGLYREYPFWCLWKIPVCNHSVKEITKNNHAVPKYWCYAVHTTDGSQLWESISQLHYEFWIIRGNRSKHSSHVSVRWKGGRKTESNDANSHNSYRFWAVPCSWVCPVPSSFATIFMLLASEKRARVSLDDFHSSTRELKLSNFRRWWSNTANSRTVLLTLDMGIYNQRNTVSIGNLVPGLRNISSS